MTTGEFNRAVQREIDRLMAMAEEEYAREVASMEWEESSTARRYVEPARWEKQALAEIDAYHRKETK